MRLFACLAPALAGVAAAATADQQQPAEAYILRSKLPAPDAAVSLQSEVAEAVLLQRLCSNVRSYPLGELPKSVSMDDAVTVINQLGKPVQPLFQESASEPHQLVIEFSGVTADNYKAIKAAIPRVPLAFTSDHTVSPRAAANTKKCAFGPSISTSRAECWEGNTQYLRYDAVKDAAIIKQLAINIGQLKSAALSGQMETIFLINGPVSHAQRRNEKPMTDTAFLFDPANPGATGASMIGVDSPEPAAESSSAPRPTGLIQACFKTEDACNKGTGNCSGHGKCTAKYPGEAAECYSCKCHTTNEDNGNGGTSVYHWGGKACQKIDVSVPFWLFLGTGVILAGMVGMCITLLYNVGEEPLPGVIGAGVSRSGSK